MFGVPITTSVTTPLFGQTAAVGESTIFGQNVPTKLVEQKSAGSNVFTQQPTGQQNILVQKSTDVNVFEQKTSEVSVFGGQNTNMFKQSPTETNIFGQKNTDPTIFGQKPAESNIFGQKSVDTNVFGQKSVDTNVFGHKSVDTNVFGQKPTDANVFGQKSTDANVFGQKSTDANVFGQKPLDTKPLGSRSLDTSSASSVFGPKPLQTIGQAPTTSNVFKQSETSANTTNNMFAQKQTEDNLYSQNSGKSSIFGEKQIGSGVNVFESKPVEVTLFAHKPIHAQDQQATVTSTNFANFGAKPESTMVKEQSGNLAPFGQTTVLTSLPHATEASNTIISGQSAERKSFGLNTSQSSVFGTKSTESNIFKQTIANSDTSKALTTSTTVFGSQKDNTSVFAAPTDISPSTTSMFKTGAATNIVRTVSNTVGNPTIKDPVSSSVFGKSSRNEMPSKTASNHSIISTQSVATVTKPTASHFSSALSKVDEVPVESEGGAKNIFGSSTSTTSVFGKLEQKVTPVFGNVEPDISQNVFSTVTAEGAERDADAKKPRSLTRRRSSHQQIYDDVSMYTGLVCKNVLLTYNNAASLRKHFSKFGNVLRVYPNTNKNSATIKFADHESALNAKKKGRMLKSGSPPMTIFWSTQVSKSVTSPKLESELSSMSGTDDERESRSRRSDRVADRLHHWGTSSPTARRDEGSRQTANRRARSVSPAENRTKDKSDVMSLNSLTGRVAQSATQRKELLDARDKVMRAGLGSKQSNLHQTNKVFVGTCEDMCPEKERYVREEQRRLSRYEMITLPDGTLDGYKVDHAKAVKEYSRSSADQEMPLSHDLRPAAVLEKTMLYLLRNIADTGNDHNWEEWFDFLWSRTRGIRKDITQQQLCNASSVRLLEACTRFHIFCAHRLCELEATEFDPKINTENLTKCLQTLKEMYSDLHQRGDDQACCNESEFRAYAVLMNLNEGDTLREVQTLAVSIRHSPLVKFAVEVYFALYHNNYVRFFKLLRSQATYLQACILHRYFPEIRTTAINNICKSHNISNRKCDYPLEALQRILCFESIDAVSTFCRHYGLEVSADQLILQPSGVVIPEAQYEPTRSRSYIECKQGGWTIGEVINNGSLAELVLSTPLCSFDRQGRFILTPQAIVDDSHPTQEPLHAIQEPAHHFSNGHASQISSTSVTTEAPSIFAPQTTIQPVAPPPQRKIPDYLIKEALKDIFLEVVDEVAVSISQSLVSATQVYLGYSTPVYQQLQDEVITDEAKDLCSEVISESSAEHAARERAKKAAEREAVAQTVMNDIVHDVVHMDATGIAHELYKAAEAERYQQDMLACANPVSDSLVAEIINEETTSIACDVYQSDVVEKQIHLDNARKATELLVCARWFRVWCDQYGGRQRLRSSMRAFPAAPSPAFDPCSQLRQLLPNLSDEDRGIHYHPSSGDTTVALGPHARLTANAPWSIDTRHQYWTLRVAAKRLVRQLTRERAWQPLDLGGILSENLPKQQVHARLKPSLDTFWKLMLVLPDSLSETLPEKVSDDVSYVHRWICAKLRKGATQQNDGLEDQSELLSLYTIPSVHKSGRNAHKLGSLSVCVRSFEGQWSDNDVSTACNQRLYQGTQAMLMIIRVPVCQNAKQTLFTMYNKQLESAVKTLPPKHKVPMSILVVHEDGIHETMMDVNGILKSISMELYRCYQHLPTSWPICSVTVNILPAHASVDEMNCSAQLQSLLSTVAQQTPQTPSLHTQSLWCYVDSAVSTCLFTHIYSDLANRRKKGLLDQCPLMLIDLYNTYIRHLSDVISDGSLCDVSWPITEFATSLHCLPSESWNSPSNLNLLKESVLDLSLPDLDLVLDDLDTWQAAVSDVWSFIDAVVENCEAACAVDLVTRISCIVRKAEQRYQHTLSNCWLTYGSDESLMHDKSTNEKELLNLSNINTIKLSANRTHSLTAGAMPWTEVVRACIDFKLQLLRESTDGVSMGQDPLTVCYYSEMLHLWQPPPFWLNVTKQLDKSVLASTPGAPTPRTVIAQKRKFDESITIPKFTLNMSTTTSTNLKRQRDHGESPMQKRRQQKFYGTDNSQWVQNDLNHTLDDFNQSISMEKERAVNYEAYLQSVLLDQVDEHECNQNYTTEDFQTMLTKPDHEMSIVKRSLNLNDTMSELDSSIQSEREADKIYEMKLQSMLLDIN